MANQKANETKKGLKGFKLSKRWITAISVVLSITLFVVTALVVSSAVKNPAVKVFDAYISAAKSQNVKKMAATLFEKDSDEYNDFVDRYEAGKTAYKNFMSSNPSEADRAAYLNAPQEILIDAEDRRDYGLRLAWEETIARNIKHYDAFVTYSDQNLIRLTVKLEYKETYSSSNMPKKLNQNTVPSQLEISFKRIGKKWYFVPSRPSGGSPVADITFRLLKGQSAMHTWFASYEEGGFEVKQVNNNDIVGGVINLATFAADRGFDNITSIGSRAFMNCTSLTSIIIPDGLTNIGSEAFKGCTALKDIKYSNGSYVTADKEITVGDEAFRDCRELLRFDLSAKNKIIPNYVFYNCAKLRGPERTPAGASASINTEYLLADTTTAIGYYAFFGCAVLTHITVPDSVVSIGDGAFENCIALRALEPYRVNESGIPLDADNILSKNITRMGANAFKKTALKAVDMSQSVIKELPLGLFNGCTGLNEAKLSDSLVAIGAYAFANTGLNKISVPASVERIGDYSFNSSKITLIDWKNNNGSTSIRTLGKYSFRACNSLVSLELPESIKGIGNGAFLGCGSLRSVMVNFSADAIIPPIADDDSSIFAMSSGIPKVYVKDGLEEFKKNWFNMRLDLYSQDIIDKKYDKKFAVINESRTNSAGVTINEKVLIQYLGDEENVTIPSDITRIGGGAFSYSKQLKTITNFNDLDLTDIGRDVFAGCGAMTFDVYENPATGKLKYLGDWLIDGSEAEGDLDFTKNSEYRMSVSGGTQYLPQTVGIASAAFESTALVTVTFNEQLKYICESAFLRLELLDRVTFDGGANGSQLLRIGADAFSGCAAIESIELPEKLAEIDARAFYNCETLRYVIINSLTPVKLGGTATAGTDGIYTYQHGQDVFSVGYDVLKLYVKNSDDSYYQNNHNWKAYKNAMYDTDVIHVDADGNIYAFDALERTFKNQEGVTTTVTEATLIQLLSLPTNSSGVITKTDFTVPSSLIRIGAGAFAKSAVQTVEIHSGVTRIEQYAFYECKELFSVKFKATGGRDSLLYIGTHAFVDTEELRGANGEIVFEADYPNENLEFGINPFDIDIIRKIKVKVRENYSTVKYWVTNADMLDAADDPWLVVSMEFVVINGSQQQVVTDFDNNSNGIMPTAGTIYMAPGDIQKLTASPDVANGYYFVGWYDKEDKLISDDYVMQANFGKANTDQAFTAKFSRAQAWVNVFIQTNAVGGTITYPAGATVVRDAMPSGGFNKSRFLSDCGEEFSLSVNTSNYPEYVFDGWYILGETQPISQATTLTYDNLTYRDVTIEARFIKTKAWVILTQKAPTGGTIALESPANYADKTETATEIRVLLAPGETVTFVATPAQFYEVDNWYQDGEPVGSEAGTYTFTMVVDGSGHISDIRVRAEFAKKKADVIFSTEGNGIIYMGSVEIDVGIPAQIPHGDKQQFVADGQPGYRFVRWSVTQDGSTRTEESEILELEILTLDDIIVVAIFETAPPVDIFVSFDSAGGTVELNATPVVPDTALQQPYNSEIILKAQLSDNYWFAGWYDLSDTANPVFISNSLEITVRIKDRIEGGEIIPAATRYEARFREVLPATLTVIYNESFGSTIDFVPQGEARQVYEAPIATFTGKAIHLEVKYDKEKYVIDGWYIGGVRMPDTENAETYDYFVSEDGAQSIEVRLLKRLTVTVNYNSDGGSISGLKEEYVTGNNAAITATASTGYRLDGWYLNNVLVTTDATLTLTNLTDSVEYEARFVVA